MVAIGRFLSWLFLPLDVTLGIILMTYGAVDVQTHSGALMMVVGVIIFVNGKTKSE